MLSVIMRLKMVGPVSNVPGMCTPFLYTRYPRIGEPPTLGAVHATSICKASAKILVGGFGAAGTYPAKT